MLESERIHVGARVDPAGSHNFDLAAALDRRSRSDALRRAMEAYVAEVAASENDEGAAVWRPAASAQPLRESVKAGHS